MLGFHSEHAAVDPSVQRRRRRSKAAAASGGAGAASQQQAAAYQQPGMYQQPGQPPQQQYHYQQQAYTQQHRTGWTPQMQPQVPQQQAVYPQQQQQHSFGPTMAQQISPQDLMRQSQRPTQQASQPQLQQQQSDNFLYADVGAVPQMNPEEMQSVEAKMKTWKQQRRATIAKREQILREQQKSTKASLQIKPLPAREELDQFDEDGGEEQQPAQQPAPRPAHASKPQRRPALQKQQATRSLQDIIHGSKRGKKGTQDGDGDDEDDDGGYARDLQRSQPVVTPELKLHHEIQDLSLQLGRLKQEFDSFKVSIRAQQAQIDEEKAEAVTRDVLEEALDALVQQMRGMHQKFEEKSNGLLKSIGDQTYWAKAVTQTETPLFDAPSTKSKVVQKLPADSHIVVVYPMHRNNEGVWMKVRSCSEEGRISVAWAPVWVGTSDDGEEEPADEEKTIYIAEFSLH